MRSESHRTFRRTIGLVLALVAGVVAGQIATALDFQGLSLVLFTGGGVLLLVALIAPWALKSTEVPDVSSRIVLRWAGGHVLWVGGELLARADDPAMVPAPDERVAAGWQGSEYVAPRPLRQSVHSKDDAELVAY